MFQHSSCYGPCLAGFVQGFAAQGSYGGSATEDHLAYGCSLRRFGIANSGMMIYTQRPQSRTTERGAN